MRKLHWQEAWAPGSFSRPATQVGALFPKILLPPEAGGNLWPGDFFSYKLIAYSLQQFYPNPALSSPRRPRRMASLSRMTSSRREVPG